MSKAPIPITATKGKVFPFSSSSYLIEIMVEQKVHVLCSALSAFSSSGLQVKCFGEWCKKTTVA